MNGVGKDLVPVTRHGVSPVPRPHSPIDVTGRIRGRFGSPPPMAYLALGEQCQIRTKLHWLVPAKSIFQSMAGIPLAFIVSVLTSRIIPGVWWIQMTIWAGTIAHQAYLAYCVLSWHHEQILVTNLRILRVRGVFTTSVASAYLWQITATDYHRSISGKLFDYGSIEIKTAGPTDINYGSAQSGSAGSHKTLERIDFLPSPLRVYQAILPQQGLRY